jgi:hypothetical protein
MSNDKSGTREDEQRKHEEAPLLHGSPVEGRTEAHLFQDTQDLEPGRRPETAERVGSAPSIDEQNAKSDFARWFRPSQFPADVRSLMRTAREEAAPDEVLEGLGRLDLDRRFETIGAVWDAVSERSSAKHT